MRKYFSKRSLAAFACVAGLSGLIPSVLSQPASATPIPTFPSSVPVQKGSGDCGASQPRLKEIGEVTYSLSGDTLEFSVFLFGQARNTTFEIYLYNDDDFPVVDSGTVTPNCDFCEEWADLGEVTTNSVGLGAGFFSISAEGLNGDNVFVDPYNTSNDHDNDTPTFLVGSGVI
jgi:hypothetical protein